MLTSTFGPEVHGILIISHISAETTVGVVKNLVHWSFFRCGISPDLVDLTLTLWEPKF